MTWSTTDYAEWLVDAMHAFSQRDGADDEQIRRIDLDADQVDVQFADGSRFKLTIEPEN